MRTDEEILARIEERKNIDWMGFESNDLIIRLPFDKVKHLLTPEATEADWQPAPRDRDSLIAVMREYMPFAWEKANDCRGISAGRSMHHYMAWTWLAGDDLGELLSYEFYGKDNLVKICQHYGWDHTQWDDGIRTNTP
jgi:hypothetical protein